MLAYYYNIKNYFVLTELYEEKKLDFNVVSPYKPAGDQQSAIDGLVDGVRKNTRIQTLLGVTGSGKTFTMAKVIEKIKKPILVLAHNKTLAAQLYREFKDFFPDNAVEYFVSYYDYYQPEAYVAASDTYIEKDASINDEIDRLRLKATFSILERDDVIVVASVSCIYGLGTPEEFESSHLKIQVGNKIDRDELLRQFVSIYYERDDISFIRGNFRVRGDVVEIYPAYLKQEAYRIEFFGDEIESISEIDPISGNVKKRIKECFIYPAKHFVSNPEVMDETIALIEEELEERVKFFNESGKLVEAQRLESKTKYDIEMLREVGYCNGIENYSRIVARREEGERPKCLLDYFKGNFMLFVDESHVSLPQVRGMFNGDRARKMNLVDYGFRLPSALDNRPLYFEEFENMIDQAIFVSATPADYEIEKSELIHEQIIRPTGLVDPKIEVRPATNQVDDLIGEINKTVEQGDRILVTSLTKKMAEDLSKYFEELEIKARYLHSDIDTIERVEIIKDLRSGEFDCLIGINLLREGLDIPEVALVAILDADKEGFLRSARSLIQTSGRAARNLNGRVIFYGDKITDSMQKAIDETTRRREIQEKYNKKNNIKPSSIKKEIVDILQREYLHKNLSESIVADYRSEYKTNSVEGLENYRARLNDDMLKAADELEFEVAAKFRDKIKDVDKKIILMKKVKK